MYLNDGNIALKTLDGALGKDEWLVDKQPTIADVDMYGVVSYATEGGFDLSQYANVSAWMSAAGSLAWLSAGRTAASESHRCDWLSIVFN